ncbi:MAG: hypothetical protein VB817_11350, partial [Pirellulaceae bacterium]
MSTDMLPDENRSKAPGEWQNSSSGRWWKRGLLLIVVTGVLASAAILIPGAISTEGPEQRLTHTIQRGDLLVSVTEQGTLESFENTEIKCKVRGSNTVTWVIESGTVVKPGDELVRLDTKRIEESVSLG